MQDLDLAEPHLAQQVELVHQRPRRVFLGDVGEDGVAIGLVLQPDEVFAIAPPHHLLDRGRGVLNQVGNPDRVEGNSARVSDCIHLVDEAIGNVREMSQLLRPTILDDFGLAAGLRWLCEGFGQRTGIDVTCEVPFTGRLPDGAETHLFRIAQEALTNVARHASAKHVRMQLEQADGHVTLRISDDGRGLSPAPGNPRGLGLIGMRARARSAGGDLEIRSRPGEGVLIEVRVPVDAGTKSELPRS